MESEEDIKIKEKCLLRVLDELGEGSKLLWTVFAVSILASILNAIHSMSYVFISEIPDHWCAIPQLQNTNFTIEQIKNISTVDECHMYDYNYEELANLEYEDAEKYVKDLKPNSSVLPCTSFVFDTKERSTIVNEWELVCDNHLYRANIFSAYAFGKLLGNAFLGIFADKYGRKNALIISLILHIIAVPSSAVVPWYWAFFFFKLITGIASGAFYSSAFTLLSEVAVNKKRKLLGTIVDIQYPIGTFIVLIISYFIFYWRHLQLAFTVFSIPMVILLWLIPESPRWLISQNRYDEAQKIIENYRKIIVTPALISGRPTITLSSSKSRAKRNKQSKSIIKRYFKSLKTLFLDPDLRKKLIIMYYSFFVSIIVGYSLVFNIDVLKTNRYIYMASTAGTEILALLITSAILMLVSSKRATVSIYFFASICMLTIAAIPRAHINIIIGMTVISKFCITASYTSTIIFALELFPPGVRNTAFGTSFAMGQLGNMGSPFLVDSLSKVAWWAPMCVCGTLTLLAGLFCCIISV